MSYLSVIIYISMITDFNELVNGSFLSLPAHGWVGAKGNTFYRGTFCETKNKIQRRKSESSSKREILETTRETISLLKEIGRMIDRMFLFHFAPFTRFIRF